MDITCLFFSYSEFFSVITTPLRPGLPVRQCLQGRQPEPDREPPSQRTRCPHPGHPEGRPHPRALRSPQHHTRRGGRPHLAAPSAPGAGSPPQPLAAPPRCSRSLPSSRPRSRPPQPPPTPTAAARAQRPRGLRDPGREPAAHARQRREGSQGLPAPGLQLPAGLAPAAGHAGGCSFGASLHRAEGGAPVGHRGCKVARPGLPRHAAHTQGSCKHFYSK